MLVREVRPDELALAGEVTFAGYRAFYGDDLGDYAAHLRDVPARAAGAVVLVALEGDQIVGTVTYVPGPESPFAEHVREGEASIRMLSVRPDAQGRGVGRVLSEACVARARAERRRAVALHADEEMGAAQRLYERLGFVRDAERDWVAEDGTRLLGYVLVL